MDYKLQIRPLIFEAIFLHTFTAPLPLVGKVQNSDTNLVHFDGI